MDVIGLGVRPTEDGGWEIRVSRPGAPPAVGGIPADHVHAVRNAAGVLFDSRTNLTDSAWQHREARVASALGAVIDRSGPPARAWYRSMGKAEGRGERAAVVLDAAPGVREIPWELLGSTHGQPPLEVAELGVVVRTAPGAPPPAPATAVAPQCIVGALGAHRVAARIEQALLDVCDARGVPGPVPPSKSLGPRLVTLVADEAGRSRAAGLLDEADPDTLDRVLWGAELILCLTIEGDLVLDDGVRTLPDRALAAGAIACVAGSTRTSHEAAIAVARALYDALVGGESLVEAVVGARRSVRLLGQPRADARWWSHRLWVGDVSALLRAPFPKRLHPRGWPHPAEDAADLLHRARAFAEPFGFFGAEHLIEALADHPLPGLEALAEAANDRRDIWMRRFNTLSTQPAHASEVRHTPRLVRLGRSLSTGFTAMELFQELLGEPEAWARWLGDVPLGDTPAGQLGVQGHGFPASALEVLGGPEDGFRMTLQPGQTIGRHAVPRQADTVLYGAAPVTDGRMSRCHLRWLGDGWVHFYSPARCVRRKDDVLTGPEGPVEIKVGDLIELTPGTTLIGVGLRPSVGKAAGWPT